MTRMTGPDCAVMCNLIINRQIGTHTHTHTHIHVHGLFIKEVAIRQIENTSEIYPNDSWNVAEGTEVERLRR